MRIINQHNWEDFQIELANNNLIFDRKRKEFFDLDDIESGHYTAYQIKAMEDWYKVDLRWLAGIYGENEI